MTHRTLSIAAITVLFAGMANSQVARPSTPTPAPAPRQTLPSGVALPGTSRDVQTWQHPVFAWDSTSGNNKALHDLQINPAAYANGLPIETVTGSDEIHDEIYAVRQSLVLYDGKIVSIKETYTQLFDNVPDIHMTALHDKLSEYGFGWTRNSNMQISTPSSNGLYRIWKSQSNRGVAITLTGHYEKHNSGDKLLEATIEYEHIARRDALGRIKAGHEVFGQNPNITSPPVLPARPLPAQLKSEPATRQSPSLNISDENLRRIEEASARRELERAQREEELARITRMTPEERQQHLRDVNVDIIKNNSGLPLPITLNEDDMRKLHEAGFDVPGYTPGNSANPTNKTNSTTK